MLRLFYDHRQSLREVSEPVDQRIAEGSGQSDEHDHGRERDERDSQTSALHAPVLQGDDERVQDDGDKTRHDHDQQHVSQPVDDLSDQIDDNDDRDDGQDRPQGNAPRLGGFEQAFPSRV